MPEAARAMINAAIADGDADDVEAVVDAARTAFPDSATQIDAVWSEYQAQQAALAAEQAAAAEAEIRQAGLFDNWSGQGQIGGFQASGNSDEIGISAALELNREGIDWEHKLRASADYRRTDGVTSREQFLVRYEPRYQINERLFAFGLAQFERNTRQGFSGRYAVSGGLGYRLVDTDNYGPLDQGWPCIPGDRIRRWYQHQPTGGSVRARFRLAAERFNQVDAGCEFDRGNRQ